MSDFITMVSRIAAELRRSNITDQIKNAVNDAIDEAAKTRFYFNEMRGVTFNTVPGTEYYDDMGIVEIDAIYYTQNSNRYSLYLDNNLEAGNAGDGNAQSGPPDAYSRQGEQLRLYPIPNSILPVYLEGYGKLSPWPLVNDTDTNAWMTTGERYIRALAKSIVLKDVIRDYSEAAVLEAIADDQRDKLLSETTTRIGTGVLRPTQW